LSEVVHPNLESIEPERVTDAAPAIYASQWKKAATSPVLRFLLLLLLLTAGAFREAQLVSAFSGDDVWRFLRVGSWILQNHSLPHTGIYSQFAASPWVDLNWPYELLLTLSWRLAGLRAFPLMLMAMKAVLAAAIFYLADGIRHYWRALLLSAAVQVVLLDLLPLPMFFSILCFTLALRALLEVRRSHNLRSILWLPFLFWLWIMMDAYFLLGWVLLAVFMLAEGWERLFDATGVAPNNAVRVPFAHLSGVVTASVGVVLLTPYSFRCIAPAFDSCYSLTLFKNFGFMAAMNFRQAAHFVVLLMVLSACFVMGQRNRRDAFHVLLLLSFSSLGFRIQNNVWALAVTAVAILSCAHSEQAKREAPAYIITKQMRLYGALSAATAALIAVAALLLPSNQEIDRRLALVVPEKACNFIEKTRPAGPIFDDYNWSGYVMWKLPEYPVAIDSRLPLYGGDAQEHYFQVVMGKQKMETLETFTSARVYLLPSQWGMTRALTEIPELKQQFREVYRDDLAVVLVRQ
jgi:hypothetical protein